MKLFPIEERKISEIIIKDRVRTDVGDIVSLSNSIKMVGQLQPILIDSNNVLIDGLHRVKAIEYLEKETIEVRIIDGITKDDYFLIEFLSNMDRKEFLWHEEIELKEKLHTFWKQQAEEKKQNWGYRETAKRLHCSLGGLSTDLAFAEALKVFPDLKKQNTKSRAREVYKALGDQAQAIQRMGNFNDVEKSRLAELQSGSLSFDKDEIIQEKAKEKSQEKEALDLNKLNEEEGKEKLSNIRVVYISENYKTFIDKIPENSVGMVELDPPYAIKFDETYGKVSKNQSKATDWTEKELYEFYFNYLELLYQKMFNGSWVLCWTGKEHFFETNKIAKECGFYTQEPGVWMKTGGSTNQPKRNLVSNWEMYLLFRKGDAQFNVPSLLSAIHFNTVSAKQRIHQWEKPIELYDHFLKALGRPGSIFLSPFAGSGNCLISAAKARMIPYGCDKSQKYIPQFYQRLENYLGISADVEGL